jgi:hypothetical protein
MTYPSRLQLKDPGLFCCPFMWVGGHNILEGLTMPFQIVRLHAESLESDSLAYNKIVRQPRQPFCGKILILSTFPALYLCSEQGRVVISLLYLG